MLGKIDRLNSILYELNTKKCNKDVACLNETHLNDSKASLCKILGYKLEFLNRSTKANGGVAILIHDTLKYRRRLDLDIFEEGIFESCFVKIEGKFKRNILVGSIYRVPNTNEKHFINTYREMAIKLKSEGKETIIGTDQNMDYLKVYTHHNTLDLLDTNLDLKLFPTILRPTRITNATATLIDNIYLSEQLATKYLSFILDCDISDHLPCLTVFNKQHKKVQDPLILKTRHIDDEKLNKMSGKLTGLDWSHLKNTDCENGFNVVHDKIKMCLDDIAPETTVRISAKRIIREPWVTAGIRKSGMELNKLHKTARFLPRDDHRYIQYLDYRKYFHKIKQVSKMTYFRQKFIDFKDNSILLWKTINEALGKSNNKNSSIDMLKVNNIEFHNPLDIANQFSKYFTAVGANLAKTIGPATSKPMDGLKKFPREKDSIFLYSITENEMSNIINSLPNKSSSGVDDISNKILKHLKNELVTPLTIVFNKSIEEGAFPTRLKLAEIIPLYK